MKNCEIKYICDSYKIKASDMILHKNTCVCDCQKRILNLAKCK